jgi:phosphoglycolate phosphatase
MGWILTTDPGSWKAIIFDFDGTLAQLNIDFSAMRAALLNLMSDYRIPAEGILNLHILEMVEAAGALLARRSPGDVSSFSHAAHKLIAKKEIEAANEGMLFDSTRPLLAALESRFIRTGVVTRNCRAAVIKTFPDIDRYCQAVMTRDDPCRTKPHPEHLMATLGLLRALPTEAAMVGDHPLDIQLGREAGTYTIGVLTGHSTKESLLQASADLILPDTSHILKIFP